MVPKTRWPRDSHWPLRPLRTLVARPSDRKGCTGRLTFPFVPPISHDVVGDWWRKNAICSLGGIDLLEEFQAIYLWATSGVAVTTGSRFLSKMIDLLSGQETVEKCHDQAKGPGNEPSWQNWWVLTPPPKGTILTRRETRWPVQRWCCCSELRGRFSGDNRHLGSRAVLCCLRTLFLICCHLLRWSCAEFWSHGTISGKPTCVTDEKNSARLARLGKWVALFANSLPLCTEYPVKSARLLSWE